jgi:hypothetical protein
MSIYMAFLYLKATSKQPIYNVLLYVGKCVGPSKFLFANKFI